MDTPHISTAEIRLALRKRDLDPAWRLRCLRHLVEPCSECLEVVRLFAAEPATAKMLGKLPPPRRDPLVATLRLLLETLRTATVVPGSPPQLTFPGWMSATQRAALRAAVEGRPLGGLWLLVEVSRQQARDCPADAEAWAHNAQQLVTIVAKGKVGEGWEKVFADVGSRACAYLGEALRLAGKHHEAEQAHDDAAELAKEGSDPELASTLHQLRAALARAQGDLTEALALLEQSAAALANAGSDVDEIWRVDLPYRRAEVLVDMGYVLSLREESEAARGVLEEALRVTESGHYPRLDLYARHNLALDKVRREQFDLAWQDLSKADPLYKPYGDDLIRAQRCWLRGTIQLSRNDPDEAVESFRRALDQYLDLGFGFDAVRIMLDLGRACVVGGQWQELANVLGWFQALGDRPILRRIILAELRRLRRLAAEQGLPTDPIEKAIEELEALQMPNRAN